MLCGEFIIHCIAQLTLVQLCPFVHLSQVAAATENFTQAGAGVPSGAESVPEDKVLQARSTDLTPVQTGTDTQSIDRNQNTDPEHLTGRGHPSDVQPWSSTISLHATKSDASLWESDETAIPAETPTAPGVAPGETGAASRDGSLLDGLQNSGFSQRPSLTSTAVTESGFVTSGTYTSPDEGIKEEKVEVSPLTVTPQVPAETHVTFSGQIKESVSPSKESTKDLEVPHKYPSQGINKVEEDLGHVSVSRVKDKGEIALDPVTLETETSSPQPLPEGEQGNRAETDTDDMKLAEEDVDRNVWTEKGPGENDVDVPIQSSSDWSPRPPPTADPVIHSMTVKATNQAPPRTVQHISKFGPGVRGQRVRPC